MDRCAVFVDAGYFFIAGAQAAFGKSVNSRRQIDMRDTPEMIASMIARATEISGGQQLLRMYWYDAMPGPNMSLGQTTLSMLPGVKLRLGAFNSYGQQKGVDSLLVTDLIDLSRNRAIADAIVITGDEDVRIAVQVAQSFGVRVHLLRAGTERNVAPSLLMEADSVHVLDAAWFEEFFVVMGSQDPAEVAMDIGAAADEVIDEILTQLTPDQMIQLDQYCATQTGVPQEYDRNLIRSVSMRLAGRIFTSEELRFIRGRFVRTVRNKTSEE
ncbi:MAG: NYN domain-containing protein [Zoogloeaceae bacterium]|jgi:uncharacterized LabA/DUF88 family protein|nr:NYN domain-containing protein [Zoogloeaceae bacterium]